MSLDMDNAPALRLAIQTRSALEPSSGCWIWRSTMNSDGYPRLKVMGKWRRAHRIAFLAFAGEFDAELTVDHICFTPACVNPAHLQLLTHSKNAARQRKALSVTCRRGHAFTPENTIQQRNRRSCGAEYHRLCRTCRRQSDRDRRAKRQAVAA